MYFYAAFLTVQPVGIPEDPFFQLVIDFDFVNVPLEATPLTQLVVQFVALMFVARQVIELSFLQPLNI